jgi:predicted flap endonuclease-1-like 5' DNA nuclease
MSYSIEDIEGIAKVYGGKLRAVGIKTTGQLLTKGCTPKGRKDLANETGISEHLILKWADMADLMRIKGIATQYSELLEKAGVDSVKELKQRVPSHLHEAMTEINGEHKLVRQLPGLKQVESWIEQAKSFTSMMQY